MFELPEMMTLSKQVNATLSGKVILKGSLGNTPHKFVWYNRTAEEFSGLTSGKRVGQAHAKGKWLFVALEPGYTLTLGECGGKMLYHPAGSELPAKYHLLLSFNDGTAFTLTTQMWGAMELYETGQEQSRQYIQGMRPIPGEAEFSFEYFSGLIDERPRSEKRSVKGLLTQEGLVPGIGNAIAQDILFRAKLHPRHPINDLDSEQRLMLYQAIIDITAEAIRLGGRCDEYDLYNRPGGYTRMMDSQSVNRPCPECGYPITKMQYLGGACYFCSQCQL